MSVLRTLQTACQSQPPPTGYLPISPPDIFSLPTSSQSDPPGTNTTQPPQHHNKDGSGLTWNAKVAISIVVPVAALLILSLICLLFYITRKNRRRTQKHLTKSYSHRSHRSNHPQQHKGPPAHLRYNHKYPPHPGHRKTLSADTALTEKDNTHAHTFNRPFSFPHHTSIHNEVSYPAPLRTRTTPSPHPTSSTHASARTPTLVTSSTSPRAKLPSHLTATTSSPTSAPLTSHSLSPPPLNVPQRPPPPPRGLVSWEQRGIQHARTKSLRDSMRRSGESGRTAGTERVKVAMQVPRDANISEWKEETRTPTPVTIMERDEEGEENRGGFRRAGRDAQGKEERKDEEEKGREGVETDNEEEWKKRVGSI
ncbi:MAG: hypothetical protein L6R41_004847 [Letrouitia leprolyta]|nr:MAG: hypothetical protein L6R41_004847 [Letrouitia leprolyta]